MRRTRCSRPATGFTYLGLLFLVVLIGLGLSAVAVVWHTMAKRMKEDELIFIGEQFKRGLKLYQQRSPDGNQLPKQLDDLVLDPRFPNVQRYLRRVYRDPMTGRPEWGLIKRPDGGIFGVYSLSEDKPLRVFGAGSAEAAPATYAEWKFAIDLAPTAQVPGPTPGQGTTSSQIPPLPPAAPLPEPLNTPPAASTATADRAEQARLACLQQRQAKCDSSSQYRTPAERSACMQSLGAEFVACDAAIAR